MNRAEATLTFGPVIRGEIEFSTTGTPVKVTRNELKRELASLYNDMRLRDAETRPCWGNVVNESDLRELLAQFAAHIQAAS